MAATAKFTAAVSKDSELGHQLAVALMSGLGTHVRTFDAGNNVLTDAWTIFGVTYTKTNTYNGAGAGAGRLTESDWMAP